MAGGKGGKGGGKAGQERSGLPGGGARKKNKRSSSSARWLREHVTDGFVRKATAEGYRARSAYKLIEIDERDEILPEAGLVVDLGSAPGGWSQVVRRRRPRAQVVAIDLLPMEPIEGVSFVQADFSENEGLAALKALAGGRLADCVICDIAPNFSGSNVVDMARCYGLCELALDFCLEGLRPGGDFLVKCFQGEGFDEYRAALRAAFESVAARKPSASRDRSNEVYLLARRKKGRPGAPKSGQGV